MESTIPYLNIHIVTCPVVEPVIAGVELTPFCLNFFAKFRATKFLDLPLHVLGKTIHYNTQVDSCYFQDAS